MRRMLSTRKPGDLKSPNRASGRGGDGGKDAGQGECGRAKRAPDSVAGRSASSDLDRIRHVSKRDKTAKFTALMHHVYNVERLKSAYLSLERNAAAGIDGVTWRSYGENLEARVLDLSARLKRGAYRAMPVRRAWIPKTDGRLRPLGVPTLEDKIVQTAVVEVLNAIYEPAFLGFSYCWPNCKGSLRCDPVYSQPTVDSEAKGRENRVVAETQCDRDGTRSIPSIRVDGALPLLRSALQSEGAQVFSNEPRPTVEDHPRTAQRANPRHVGTHESPIRQVAAIADHLPSLSPQTLLRHYPRQEPYAIISLVRICAGGSA
jgi:hypothetical protein